MQPAYRVAPEVRAMRAQKKPGGVRAEVEVLLAKRKGRLQQTAFSNSDLRRIHAVPGPDLFWPGPEWVRVS